MCEKVIIEGWGIEPGFDEQSGRLNHVSLDFLVAGCQICELVVMNEFLPEGTKGEYLPRINIFKDDGKTKIWFCLKKPEEEKYGAWLEIDLTDRPDELAMLQGWLTR
ncbi:MAG: hypothetical protein ACOYBR_03010 [Fluviibacter sp.]